MGTIAEKLAYTANAIDDIQAAIIEQGVEVGANVPLADYGDKVRAISGGGPGPSPTPAASMTVVVNEKLTYGDTVSESYTVVESGLYFVCATLGDWNITTPPTITSTGTSQYSYDGDNYAVRLLNCAANNTISISYDTSSENCASFYYIVKINGYSTIGNLLERVDSGGSVTADIGSYETNNDILIYFGAISGEDGAGLGFYCLQDSNYQIIGSLGSIDYLLCPMISYPDIEPYNGNELFTGGLMVVDKSEIATFIGSWESESQSVGSYLAWEIS